MTEEISKYQHLLNKEGLIDRSKFSPEVNNAFDRAINLSDRLNHHHFGTEHLLGGLVEAQRVMDLSKTSLNAERIEESIIQEYKGRGDLIPYGTKRATPATLAVISKAIREADGDHLPIVRLIHVWESLLDTDGLHIVIIERLGVDLPWLQSEVRRIHDIFRKTQSQER